MYFTNRDNEKRWHYQRFESVDALLKAGDKAVSNGKRWRIGSSYFVGREFKNWEQVRVEANQYWQEGLDIVQDMLYHVEKEEHNLPQPVDRRRRKVWNSDGGDELDRDRLMAGQDYWCKTVRKTVTAPQHITLVTNIGALGTAGHDEILWRGAVGIVLADMLEKAGYRVESWCLSKAVNVYTNEENAAIAVKVKDTESPVDISTIVNAVSGWFFRTVFFQVRHNNPNRCTVGLGSTLQLKAEDPHVVDLLGNNSTLVLIDNVWRLNQAIDKVKEVVAKLATVSEPVG